jgi:hypothetical protein
MADLFKNTAANPMFPPPVAMPAQVPTSFEMWRSDPMNLAKINQPPEAAMAPNLPAIDKTMQPQPSPLEDSFIPPASGPEPVAPQMNLGGAPAPQLNAPPTPGFDVSGIMPKRPTSPLENMPKGKFALMGLATLADNIGAALSHGTPTVGKEWLGELANTREKQQQYDVNAPKLQYDLTQGVKSDALRNAAMAAGTAHTVQETANLAGAMSPLAQRKAAFVDEWTKNAQNGQYSPDAVKAAMKRAAVYHQVELSDPEIDSIVSGPVPPPKFEFKSGAIEPVTYRGVRYGPKPTAGEPAEIAQARKEATDALNQSIQTDKQKGANKVAVTMQMQQGDQNSPEHLTAITSIAKGDAPLSTLLPRGATISQRENLISQIKAINPDWKDSDFDVAKAATKDVTSGSTSVSLRAIATAREHMKLFSTLADKLNNGDMQAWNSLGNAIGVKFGDNKATNFALANQAFGGEIGRALDGAGVTAGERDEAKKNFSDAFSTGQFKGATDTVDKLLEGKQKAAKDTYDLALKGQGNFGQGTATHIVKDASGKRIGTVVNGTYVADK